MIRRSLIGPLVALIVGAACSLPGAVASADTAGDLARIAGAGPALTKAGSAKFTGLVVVGGGQLGGVAPSSTGGTVKLTGGFDFKHRTGQFTIGASALGAARASAKIQVILVNGVVYFSIDSLKHLTPGTLPSSLSSKQWLKLDLKTLGAGAGQLNQADPSSSLDALRGVSDVQNLGSDTVRGAATTHYRIHIDLAQAIQHAPPAQRPQIQRSIDALGGTGTLPADIWLDRQGRPRKYALTYTAKSGTTNTSASVMFEYSDFGAAVTATAPPASQVADFSKLFSIPAT